MVKIRRLGHYALKVSDVDRSTSFYRDIIGLHERDRGQQGEVYLQRGPDHHCLVLYPADYRDADDPELPEGPILHHVGWEVASEADLSEAGKYLEGKGVTLLAGPKVHEGPGRHTYLRFTDPFGIRHELFCDMEQAEEDAPDRPFRPQKLGHVAFGTKDIDASAKFATEVLGFRVSDWLAELLCFVRCNEDHHAITFLANGLNNLQHTGYEAETWEDLKRISDHVSRNGMTNVWGPGRHGPGNNVFVYVKDPDGNIVEAFAELIRIPDEEKWEPKVWEMAPRSADYWGTGIPDDFIPGPGWSY